ncbi:peptidoglycan DD-metalloendopeptidase family protein [Sphingomonas sp. BK345]|uniref:peptidoglycan DD-metalloendopeptidase family protein n=1 Tax=Sphingomonas sp. BK345 TaxID=2586980 RepID=UPI00180FFB2E|nr:peptidoglycan DD-metalloendopeptidase family protein [Sphingomonas sp. BK345]MBB3475105.1 murein DD-endopeptidase MepM/ murein hydrolase activator NlpD [Sphingomonas sp. BK345]
MREADVTRAAALALLLTGCIPAAERPAPAPPIDAQAAEAAGQTGGDEEVTTTEEQVAPTTAPARARGDRRDVAQLPAPRPAWEARPVAPDARAVTAQRYTVRVGDTLGAIAARTGAGVDAIARANALSPPYPVRAGQTLAIPGGRYHLVRAGQTGIAIARAYGVPWSEVIAANALDEPYLLRAGQRVLIPRAPGAPVSAAERAAAFTLDVDTILTGGEPAVVEGQAPATPVASARRVLAPSAATVAPAALPGRFVWPVDGTIVRRFGPGATGERNDGIKIAIPLDTPVRAIADGTVAYVGSEVPALGGLVIVRHGGGWTSVYGHAGTLLVQRGQAVRKGQVIARSGESGYADRPELHFELRRGRTPVDPTTQLPHR